MVWIRIAARGQRKPWTSQVGIANIRMVVGVQSRTIGNSRRMLWKMCSASTTKPVENIIGSSYAVNFPRAELESCRYLFLSQVTEVENAIVSMRLGCVQ